MINAKYAFEKGGPKRLEILWLARFSEVHIKLDGKEIASFNGPDTLLAGQEFTLDDGSRLKVQLAGRSMLSSFNVTLNGRSLSSNIPDAARRLKSVYQFLFMIAAFNILAGLTSFRSSLSAKYVIQNGWLLVICGLIVLVLALLVMRKSKIALTIAVIGFALDTIAFLFYTGIPPWGRILVFIFRFVLLLALLSGFGAINELKQAQNNSESMNNKEGDYGN
jgi:hypothetical protein